MRILYGVCGDGMGHAMRSAVVGRHLARRGHEIAFASSKGAKAYLEKAGAHVIPIVGLSAVMVDNRVSPLLSLGANLFRQLQAPATHLAAFANAARFQPDVVISDFDPWTARFAAFTGAPLIAVDNIHFMSRCRHPAEVVERDRGAAALMYPVTDAMVPNARQYLVTSFVEAPVVEPRTTLHQPILRERLLGARGAPDRGHVVAYFNDKSDHAAIAAALAEGGAPARLYGRRGQTREERHGSVTLCPFSDDAFMEDMATSRAVVGGAGFTLMTEAIYLGKPMLAVPFGSQYEQILNANYLEGLGWGERADRPDGAAVRAFLARAPAYAARLRDYQHDGNAELLDSVERAILC